MIVFKNKNTPLDWVSEVPDICYHPTHA